VLKWVFDRCGQEVGNPLLATATAIGYLPTAGSIDRAGLPVSDSDMKELLRFDAEAWRAELPSLHTHYAQFGERLPGALREQLSVLEGQLQGMG
jgi:phosphoenolpyruvate carboxykinase (GTP)